MSLCAERLRKTLEARLLYRVESPTGLVELIRYVWLHTMDTDEGCDAMRSGILRCLILHIGKLCKNDWFLELLSELGSFSSDLVRAMAPEMEKRLGYPREPMPKMPRGAVPKVP